MAQVADGAGRNEAAGAADGIGADEIAGLAGLFADGPLALLTGAGVSTDSGIPDYRGAGTPPRTPMSIDQFTRDEAYRRRFWAGARAGADRLAPVQPNAGHRAAAELERDGYLSGVITQNVDGLHARAGSVNLAELHGNGAVIRCIPLDHRFSREEVLRWFDVANPGFAERWADAEITPDGDAAVTDTTGVRVPVCPACGGMLRPDVVYFGEVVPQRVFAHAERIVAGAAGLLVAGTSLAVNTGMRLVHRAERRGIPLAVINRGPTAIDGRDSVRLRIEGGTSEALTALVSRLAAR
ncbi:Sir2 family NAD-dependent protein deacetylase [Leucobacter massiliensis]|uniref:protein acetyllysine N-acetyltransferase n=1 Tax=Leucobacter massiliensis TaxID=1686285 RepID=A0A2S9QNV3_9MICO|nr:Sir2 family NAD-dependent protein deacetylase [Leucobacter massiliensis]PRI11259.1 NAD-dependent deacetylase [Leucobacter massiliensis]